MMKLITVLLLFSPAFLVAQNPTQLIIYEVPFDVHLGTPLDSVSIKGFSLTRKHIINDTKLIKNIISEISASDVFQGEKCDLDLRIFCEGMSDNGEALYFSVGSTKLINSKGRCLFAKKRLLRRLCARRS
jgi:hypothetical protein